jgi:hypothetical protein
LFLLGHWKSYEELEENLSMPELINTFEAMRKKDYENKKFQASLKGINLDEENNKEGGPTFEDVKLRAAGINADRSDVLSLQGSFAAEAGFGIGAGLGYSRSN